MGAWGPKLYQDDIAEEVRNYYKEQVRRGKTGNQITQELIEKNKYVISDPDDAPVFWFALADTQWHLGRLENHTKEQAIYYINEGRNLRRWELENPQWAKNRVCVLSELKQKLLLPQPSEKKVSQYKLYNCEWKIGDVYAYQLLGDYAKENALHEKYLFFVKVDEEMWHPGHIVPVVYFYWVISDTLIGIDEIKKMSYIPQLFTPKAYKNNQEMRTQYLLTLLSTSSRVVPKKQLTFLGNIKGVQRMVNENPNPYQVSWKDFEKYIIDNFQIWKDFPQITNV